MSSRSPITRIFTLAALALGAVSCATSEAVVAPAGPTHTTGSPALEAPAQTPDAESFCECPVETTALDLPFGTEDPLRPDTEPMFCGCGGEVCCCAGDEPMPPAAPAVETSPATEPAAEVEPRPEATPAPEAGPMPAVELLPEATPMPEVEPMPEATPAPEPRPEATPAPAPQVTPAPPVIPTPVVPPATATPGATPGATPAAPAPPPAPVVLCPCKGTCACNARSRRRGTCECRPR